MEAPTLQVNEIFGPVFQLRKVKDLILARTASSSASQSATNTASGVTLHRPGCSREPKRISTTSESCTARRTRSMR